MLNRYCTIVVIAMILLVPSFLLAADKFAPGDATIGADNTVIIPLNISNQDDLMAVTIPLSFSDGVVLKEVVFEDTRVSYFDLKIAKINNEENTVLIGLLTQVWPESREYLDAGEGTVAKLVFEVVDASVSEITLEGIVMEDPHHSLTYVYNTRVDSASARQKRTEIDFGTVSVSLSSAHDASLPSTFSLEQNYPNPFNPTTSIDFGLPVASHVRLVVYNMLGQQVTSVIDDDMPAGQHTVTWDGNNDTGGQVATGIYFYRLEADGFKETKKMMLLK